MLSQTVAAIGFTVLFSVAMYNVYKWFAWLLPQAIDFSLFEKNRKKEHKGGK